MHFTCTKEDLYEGVQTVERIVSVRSTLPIIGNILFETGKGGLKLSANNLEMGMEISLPAKVEEEGSILIPAKTLGQIVGRFPEGDIKFKSTEKGLMRISYRQSIFNLHGLPPDDLPKLRRVKEGKTLTLNPKLFMEMVKQTIFAVSLSEEKYVLNGVLIEIGKTEAKEQSNLRMVATDGYRLTRRGEKITPAPASSGSAIVPAKALAEVARLLAGGDGELKITLGKEQIAFQYKDAYLVSRLIQGQFPDYKQVIPKKGETQLTIDTQGFLEAAERAAVIASSSANIVKLELKGGKLHIGAATPDVGSVDEVVDVEAPAGAKAHIAFNVRLITEGLKVLGSEKAVLELSGPLSPGVIRPAVERDHTYIIMPIRTTEAAAKA